MEQHYAQALWNMLEKGMTPKKAVAALHQLLASRGRQHLMPRIAHAFARLAQRQMKREQVLLSIAKEKDEARAKRHSKDALRELDAEPRDVVTTVDETLIGGWRLEGREHLVDGSFKKQLLSLYNRAIQ